MLASRKTLLFAIMYAQTREIRIVENPDLKDPTWEGVGGSTDIYAQRYMRRISENVVSHALRRRAAADLEGFAHSAAA